MSRKRKTNKDLPERVYLKHGAYYFVTPENKWIRLEKTKAEMYKTLMELEIRPTGGYNVESLWNDFESDAVSKLSPPTQNGYSTAIKQILKVFGHMMLDEIKPSDIAKYLLVRGKKAPTTANREIAVLSSMYTYAVSLGHCERNPCLRVKRHKLAARSRRVEDWELREFRRVCNEQLDCYCELKELTGLRMTDMLLLSLANIKKGGLYVRPNKTKNSTGEPREYIWTDDLRAVIERIKRLPRPVNETRLFVNMHGKPYINAKLEAPGFSDIWRKTMKKALLETELREPFQEKDIRAKTATDADEKGQNATALLGHGDKKTTERYIRHKKVKRIMPLIRDTGEDHSEDFSEGE